MGDYEGKVIFCAPVELASYSPGKVLSFSQTYDYEMADINCDIWHVDFDKSIIIDLVNPDNHYELWIVKKEK